MEIIVFLKTIADLSYYYTFIGIISCLVFGFPSNMIPIVLIIAFINQLTFKYRNSKFSLAPFLLLPTVLFFCHNTSDFALLVLPVIYLIFIATKKKYATTYSDLKELLFNELKCTLLVFVFTPGFGYIKPFYSLMVTMFILYIASMTMAIRMMRADDILLNSKSYKLMHLRSVTTVIGLGFLFGNSTSAKIIKMIFGLIYNNLIFPILMLPIKLVAYLAGLLNLKPLKVNQELQELLAMQQAMNQDTLEEMAEQAIEPNVLAQSILFGTLILIVAIVVIIVVYYISKKMMGNTYDIEEQTYVKIKEEKITTKKHGFKDIFSPKSNVDILRSIYRKFIKLFNTNISPVSQTMTTAQIDNLAGSTNETKALREIYIKARYSDKEITQSDIITAKELLQDIKKEKEN